MYMKWKAGRGAPSPAPPTQNTLGTQSHSKVPAAHSSKQQPLPPIREYIDVPDNVKGHHIERTHHVHIRLVPEPELTAIYGIERCYSDLKLRRLTEEELDALHNVEAADGESDTGGLIRSADHMLAGKDMLHLDILKGNFNTLPPPKSKVVRVFLSSTFSDMRAERNILHRLAHPKLQALCQSLGLEYQVVDMRWGVTDEAVNEHLTSKLCIREIKNCQRISAGPNFITLLGNRYGYRPLQVEIPAAEFDCLVELAEEAGEASARRMFQEWYRKDDNADPAVYVLQPIASNLKHYNDTREQNADLRKAAQDKWTSVSAYLYSTLTAAANEAVHRGLINAKRLEQYVQSVTEEEINHGVLVNPKSSQQCVAFHRYLTGYEPHLLDDPQVRRYIDVTIHEGQTRIDDNLQARLNKLAADSIPNAIGERNCCNYEVEWTDGGVTLENQKHQKYLETFCKDYVEKLSSLIKDCTSVEIQNQDHGDPVFLRLITEVEQHARFCKHKCATFCGQSKVLEKVRNYVTDRPQLPLVVHGESGVGKTSLMAMVAQLLPQWLPDCNLVLRFLGTTRSSSTIVSLLQSVILQLCYLYNMNTPPPADMDSFTTLSRFFSAQLQAISETTRKPLLLLLDSLDQLSPAHGAYLLTWLPRKLPQNVQIIVSTIPKTGGILDRLLIDPVMVNGDSFIEVEGLDSEVGLDVLRMRLQQNQRKVSAEQEAVLCKTFEQCPQALYIKLAIDRALTWQSYTEVTQHQLGSSVQEAIIQLFMDLENKYGVQTVRFALGYITVSDGGLSGVELEDALSCNDQVLNAAYQYHNPPLEGVIRIPPLLWARISYDLDEYLTEREVDGKTAIFWYHRQFLEGAMVKFVSRAHATTSGSEPDCCEGFTNHSHRLHSDLAKVFNAEQAIRETIRLHHRKLTIEDADRCIMKQARSKENLRWLNALPFHLMQPEFHNDDMCQQLRQLTLCNFHWLLAKSEAEGLSETLNEYIRVMESCHCQHKEVKIMRDFLVLAEPAIRYRPNLLPTEILARLPTLPELSKYPNMQKLIKDAEAWFSEYKYPVMCPVQPCLPAPGGLMKARIVGPQLCVAKPEKASIVVGCSNFTSIRLGVWSTQTNELLHILETPPGYASPTQTKVDHKGTVLVTLEDARDSTSDKTSLQNSAIVMRVYNPVEGTLKLRLRVGEQDACHVLDLSPDGVLVALGSQRGLVYIVNLQNQKIGSFQAHSGPVKNIRLSLDGKLLVTSGKSLTTSAHQVTSWKLSTLQAVHTTEIPAAVNDDMFYVSRNSPTLSAICGSKFVLRFCMNSGNSQLTKCVAPSSPTEFVTCLSVSWDGRVAVAGGSAGHVWVVQEGRLAGPCHPVFNLTDEADEAGSKQKMNHVAVTWDAQFVMAATRSGQIHIWHLPSVTKVKVIYAHATGINGLTLSADHKSLFSSAPDLYIKEWRVGRLLQEFLQSLQSNHGPREAERSTNYKGLQLSQDGNFAILEPTRGPPEMWDVKRGLHQHTLTDPAWTSSLTIQQVVLQSNRLLALSAAVSGGSTRVGLHVWDVTSHQLLMSLPAMSVRAARISPDATTVVFVIDDGEDCVTVQVWSSETLTMEREFSVTTDLVTVIQCVIVTHDNNFAVMLSSGKQRRRKDQETRGGRGWVERHERPQGRKKMSQAWTLEVVDLVSEEIITDMSNEGVTDGVSEAVGDVVSVARLPDRSVDMTAAERFVLPVRGGRILVACGVDRVWEVDASTQTICQILKVNSGERSSETIKCMCVSEDGERVVVGASSGTSVVFCLSSGEQLIRTHSVHNQVWSAVLSVDNSLLICGYRNNMIEVWDMKTQTVRCDMMLHADVANLAVTRDKTHLVALIDSKVTQRAVFIKLLSYQGGQGHTEGSLH